MGPVGPRLAEGVLTQISSLLNADCAGILVLREGLDSNDTFSVLAGSGCYSRFTGSDALETLSARSIPVMIPVAIMMLSLPVSFP